MDGLPVSGLADLAGATEAEVVRLVELGVLAAREGAGPFRDVPKVRLAVACEQAGLPWRALLDEGLELSLATRSTRNVTLCLTAFAQLAFVEGGRWTRTGSTRGSAPAPGSIDGRQ
jgi:hypothetical protein